MPLHRLLLALLIIFSSHLSWAREESVLIAPIYSLDNPQSNNYYFVRLLQLALDKTTDSHGPYQLKEPASYLIDNRLRASLANGDVDIAWFTSFPEAEERFLKVDYPLLGEINEYRLLLIREEDKAAFSKITRLEALRELTAGMGSQWADRAIFDANNLPYVTGPRYTILFRMLQAGRFDYFPRGLYQVKNELDHYPQRDFVIVENFMLHYPNSVSFFVNKNNKALAERIQRGLEEANEDGSFEALYNSFEQFRWAEQQLQDSSRQIFYLTSPGAPATSLSPSNSTR